MFSSDLLIYLTGDRTALGIVFLATVLLILSLKQLQILRIVTLLISLILIIVVSIADNSIKHRNIDYTLNQFGAYSGSEGLNIFSPNHDKLIRSSAEMFLSNPIFGVGPNNFRFECPKLKYYKGLCSTHTHNSFIQVLSELGIAGIILLLVSMYFILKFFFIVLINKYNKSNSNISDFQICLVISLSVSLFPLIPSMNFFNNWINTIYFLPVGFYLYEFYYRKVYKT